MGLSKDGTAASDFTHHGEFEVMRTVELLSANSARALGSFLLRIRVYVLAFSAAATAISLFLIFDRLHFDAGFEKSIPNDHPYMETYRRWAGAFGGANAVTIALVTEKGDAFEPQFLKTLGELSRSVYSIQGVNQASVSSLFSPGAVFVTVNEDGFAGGRIIPATFVADKRHSELVRKNTLRSAEVGKLVSRDLKAAIIRFELLDRDLDTGTPLDYRKLDESLAELRKRATAQGYDLHIIGFGQFIADVIDGTKAVVAFFAVTVGITGILLFWFSGSWLVTVITLTSAIIAVVWQLGIVTTLGLGVDPLSVLVPFLIFTIGVSHAVQMTSAWRAALTSGSDQRAAALSAFQQLFIPGATALLANVVGFTVISTIDIPIIRELGLISGIGVGVMIISNKAMLPAMLSMLPLSEAEQRRSAIRTTQIEGLSIWRLMSRCTDAGPKVLILLCGTVALLYSVWARGLVIVGDVNPGAPELRPASRYNQDILAILDKFDVGLDELTIVASLRRGCTDFEALYWIDRLSVSLEKVPGVKIVDSLARQVRLRTIGDNEGHPRFTEIPRDPSNIGGAMRQMELRQQYFDIDCTTIPVRIFTEDHRAETLRVVLEEARKFSSANPTGSVELEFVGGNGGVAAATNDAVEAARDRMLIILYCAVGALCWITFSSLRMTFCVLAPLLVVSQFAEAVMVWLGIGLKTSTLPVVALGTGVGVDYGIYILARVKAHLNRGVALAESFVIGMREAGKAVVFTAVMMSIGVLTWAFSPLQLQADMGVLLAYMFFVNMLAAVTFLPAFASILRVKPTRITESAE
jgi:uncharacterized protein